MPSGLRPCQETASPRVGLLQALQQTDLHMNQAAVGSFQRRVVEEAVVSGHRRRPLLRIAALEQRVEGRPGLRVLPQVRRVLLHAVLAGIGEAHLLA